MTQEDYERALARVPYWIVALGVIGTGIAARYAGLSGAAGFAAGVIGAWINFLLIERGVTRIIHLASSETGKIRAGSGVRMYLQFAILAALAFVILRFTGFNLKAAICGFLVCPLAAMIEIVYELLTYGHS